MSECITIRRLEELEVQRNWNLMAVLYLTIQCAHYVCSLLILINLSVSRIHYHSNY